MEIVMLVINSKLGFKLLAAFRKRDHFKAEDRNFSWPPADYSLHLSSGLVT